MNKHHYQHSITAKADHEFCNILCAWDDLERTLESGEIIVDFNLIEWNSDRTYSTRGDVRDDLARLATDPSVRSDRKVFSRVIALQAYLCDLMSKRNADYESYLRDRAGLKLHYIPDDVITTTRQALEDQFQTLGTPFKDGKEGLKRISQNTVAFEKIPRWIETNFKPALRIFKDIMGENLRIKKPIVTLEDTGTGTWDAEISAQGRLFKLAFNRAAHEERNEQDLQLTFHHEVLGHAVQGHYWREAIESGKLPRSFGLTTVVGPEIFSMEALAEYIPLYFSNKDDKIFAANHALQSYDRMIWNNAYYKHFLDRQTDEAVAAYVAEHTPYRPQDFIKNRIELFCHSSATYSVYAALYDPGRRMMTHIMDQLNETDKKAFLRENYTQWLDTQDIVDLAKAYGVEDIPHFTARRSEKLVSLNP